MREDTIEAIYPLSPVQLGILFHSIFDQRSSVYVESLTFSLHGPLDRQAFKAAWDRVIERHSVLRTFFVWKNRETPLQIVRRHGNLPWQELDWRHLPGEEQRENLHLLLKSDQEQGFDLSKAPPLRLMLIRLSEESYQFIWSYHHILLDGWSLAIVLEEVFTLYRSLYEGWTLSLRQPQPYKQYVNWLTQRDLTDSEMFWREKLQGFTKPTSLDVDGLFAKSVENRSGYESRQLCLSQDVSTALRSLAREHQLTLNTVLQGAWAILLSRYSGESDIVFGVAVSGRSVPLASIESMVGLFISSIPVRAQLSPQMPLIDWLVKFQDEQIKARQFEYTSLKDIQAWSAIDRFQGKSLFDTILSFNNYDFDRVFRETADGLDVRDVSFREGSHYPLTVLIDPGEQIRIRINYDGSRFDDGTAERILAHLEVLLQQMAAQPSGSISSFSLLTAAENQKLLVDFNHTGTWAPPEKSVVQLFEEQVRLNPDAVAVQFDDQSFTFGQLNIQANRLARHLKKLGIGSEKVVALCMDRSALVIVAILGTLKAGGGYLPLDSTLPSKRLALMLEETRSPLVLTTERLAHELPPSDAAIIRLDTDWAVIEAESGENLPLFAEPEDLAYIIYTSGSTGRPKGTMVQHSNLLNYIMWARDFYLQGEKLVFPLFSSLSFDLTVTSIFVPLVSGGSIVIYDESETPGLEVLDVIREDRVDIIKLTPAHLTLLQAGNQKSERLRKMIVGGEDFKRSLAQGIYDLFDGRIEIYNEYGPTETTVGCMIHRFDPARDTESSVPIGQPIHNSQIYILDKHLLPVPPGVIGEMCIGGASVARGYLQRSELTGSKFVSDPFHPGGILYRTGDLARWTPDGQMQFLGRADHQVKIKGYRIELGEIENNLLDHPDIKSAVVTAFQPVVHSADAIKRWCAQCGLPDNYPDAEFDSTGVCKTCREFSELKEQFRSYFKTPAELYKIADHARQVKTGEYDCIVLYSGGKDSTYMLYTLVKEYGLRPLVFSLDNGYISEEAKENMRRVTEALGVDLVFGQTPHMNVIFADSLKRHSNVCNGCYKVIYTLSINLARQKGIRYIFTGLSRGQLFETRLSDMFQARIFDDVAIDRTVLAARKAYHKFEDAVTQLMDVKVFEDDNIFDDIQLVDFYRYVDVPLQQMYTYLEQNAPWIRPSDTGRSTNCLINDVGIYIHKRERGFHNYALPYSWDVRMGHKTRDEAIDELNDDIDEKKVHKIMDEIGYDEMESDRTLLAAYFVARRPVTSTEVRAYLENSLPSYMIPSFIKQLDQIPLTLNGKIDREALPGPESRRMVFDKVFVAPETSLERQLADIWSEVLHVTQIGVHDNFFELGGDSISTIHVMMRVSQIFNVNLRPVILFEMPTISGLADRIEKMLIEEIEKLTEEEAKSLLEEDDLKRGGGR